MKTPKVGLPYPRGACFDGKGTNFALFSDHATSITLCLFSKDGDSETERIELKECTNGVWHGYLDDVKPGQLYGYRVDGPWVPVEGLRFNKNKLLLDPYARKLSGSLKWDDALFGYTISGAEDSDLIIDERDSALFMPKAVVIDSKILVAAGKTQYPLAEIRDLRSPCKRLDHATSADSKRYSRHLCCPERFSIDRPSAKNRHYRHRADARACF